ncbi:hypothetical protein CHS0354_023561 [Potamilus streckersoni]|uniref:Uncharacterized protein n=1 Tax=Potamilus streckersoni TaxID=2493646 RepID=A0AAE0S8S5_9BIVA|nr:hypothetical protein CHS0354_023561 [Potamilus streckersoni]
MNVSVSGLIELLQEGLIRPLNIREWIYRHGGFEPSRHVGLRLSPCTIATFSRPKRAVGRSVRPNPTEDTHCDRPSKNSQHLCEHRLDEIDFTAKIYDVGIHNLNLDIVAHFFCWGNGSYQLGVSAKARPHKGTCFN